ncbi:hypothetical protein BN2497_4099 [Janthinobacterium sp. CG23_2]|nr:hypothetical protein BN2497_4099 [Janthinobacterium sp. CG23_2]CUU28447.1 hypothetical protein BN3177_4099 [Janthinobacterium sp. CG23_2]
MPRIDEPDRSPMRLISADLLAQYGRWEAKLVPLKAAARPK